MKKFGRYVSHVLITLAKLHQSYPVFTELLEINTSWYLCSYIPHG
uniref:Uncharacterized protein n=1 Tax=Arundo donax TaxID=35708 RepID=A0A0A9FKS8_ARUDO